MSDYPARSQPRFFKCLSIRELPRPFPPSRPKLHDQASERDTRSCTLKRERPSGGGVVGASGRSGEGGQTACSSGMEARSGLGMMVRFLVVSGWACRQVVRVCLVEVSERNE